MESGQAKDTRSVVVHARQAVTGTDTAEEMAAVDVVTAGVGRHDDVVTGVVAGVTRDVIIVTDATDVRRTEVVAVIGARRGGRGVAVEAPLVLR